MCVPFDRRRHGLKGVFVPLSGVSGTTARHVTKKHFSFPDGFHPGSFHGSARQTASPSSPDLAGPGVLVRVAVVATRLLCSRTTVLRVFLSSLSCPIDSFNY